MKLINRTTTTLNYTVVSGKTGYASGFFGPNQVRVLRLPRASGSVVVANNYDVHVHLEGGGAGEKISAPADATITFSTRVETGILNLGE